MVKRILSVVMGLTLVFSLAACGASSSDDSTEESKKEYIEESEIADMFTNPDDYKGKYVKLSGQVFTSPEKDGDEIAFQVWHDVKNYENDFVVNCSADSDVESNDYVVVDGKISGAFTGENAFGSEVTCPLIEADSVEVQSYMEAVVPTITEITPENAVAEQHGITLKVDKVEFAKEETRLYLTESNSSEDAFDFYTYDIKITQNGKQIEQDSDSSSMYSGNYDELADEILPNATSSGVLVYPAMDSSASFEVHAEGSSDNYDLEFDEFTIEVPVK